MLWGRLLLVLRMILFFSLLASALPSYAWDFSVDARAQGLAHYIMAVCHDANGESAQAVREYQQSIKFDALEPAPRLNLGAYYFQEGKNPEAIREFLKVLHLDPANSEALNSLGYIYAEEGVHLDEALMMVRKAIAIDPDNGAYYDSLGWVLYKKGLYTEALVSLQKAQTLVEDEELDDHIGAVLKALKQQKIKE